MGRGLSSKLAGKVGEFLVCAELGRRGFIATSFTGNVPEFDLVVANDSLKTLPVQVKTSRGNSWPTSAAQWIDVTIDEEEKKQIDHGNLDIKYPDLVYICVLLAPTGVTRNDRYFLLRKRDVQDICANNYRTWMAKHDWKRPKNFRSLDNRCYVKDLEPFEDNWVLIEQKLWQN